MKRMKLPLVNELKGFHVVPSDNFYYQDPKTNKFISMSKGIVYVIENSVFTMDGFPVYRKSRSLPNFRALTIRNTDHRLFNFSKSIGGLNQLITVPVSRDNGSTEKVKMPLFHLALHQYGQSKSESLLSLIDDTLKISEQLAHEGLTRPKPLTTEETKRDLYLSVNLKKKDSKGTTLLDIARANQELTTIAGRLSRLHVERIEPPPHFTVMKELEIPDPTEITTAPSSSRRSSVASNTSTIIKEATQDIDESATGKITSSSDPISPQASRPNPYLEEVERMKQKFLNDFQTTANHRYLKPPSDEAILASCRVFREEKLLPEEKRLAFADTLTNTINSYLKMKYDRGAAVNDAGVRRALALGNQLLDPNISPLETAEKFRVFLQSGKLPNESWLEGESSFLVTLLKQVFFPLANKTKKYLPISPEERAALGKEGRNGRLKKEDITQPLSQEEIALAFTARIKGAINEFIKKDNLLPTDVIVAETLATSLINKDKSFESKIRELVDFLQRNNGTESAMDDLNNPDSLRALLMKKFGLEKVREAFSKSSISYSTLEKQLKQWASHQIKDFEISGPTTKVDFSSIDPDRNSPLFPAADLLEEEKQHSELDLQVLHAATDPHSPYPSKFIDESIDFNPNKTYSGQSLLAIAAKNGCQFFASQIANHKEFNPKEHVHALPLLVALRKTLEREYRNSPDEKFSDDPGGMINSIINKLAPDYASHQAAELEKRYTFTEAHQYRPSPTANELTALWKEYAKVKLTSEEKQKALTAHVKTAINRYLEHGYRDGRRNSEEGMARAIRLGAELLKPGLPHEQRVDALVQFFKTGRSKTESSHFTLVRGSSMNDENSLRSQLMKACGLDEVRKALVAGKINGEQFNKALTQWENQQKISPTRIKSSQSTPTTPSAHH